MFTTFPGRASRYMSRRLTADISPDLFTGIYHFSIGVSGLAYIGLGLGFVSATVVGASVADSIYQKVCILRALACPDWAYIRPRPTQLSQRNGGKGTPEMRIPALIFGSLFVPIGLL